MSKYILQTVGDGSCSLVTLLNFCVFKNGKLPIKYRSKEYMELLEECSGLAGPILYIKPALDKLKLRYENCPKFRSMKKLKIWLNDNLLIGNQISFCMGHPRFNLHSILITNYYKTTNKYKVFNAQLYTKTNTIEYLTFKEILGWGKHNLRLVCELNKIIKEK